MGSTPTPLTPFFKPPISKSGPRAPEPPAIQSTITTLSMLPHIEGGYFVETDRDPALVPSPFPSSETTSTNAQAIVPQRPGFDPLVRNASTTIFYLLTPGSPQGNFHRNRARTVHTLHRGRGRYVLLHVDEAEAVGEGRRGEQGGGGASEVRIETFVVGPDVAKGERLQWIVEGGKYKASFLLPDWEGGETSEGGLLISETVVPGFEYCDHDFLTKEGLKALMGEERAKGLEWLVRE